MKIAIISTYKPLQCGIATFSEDLYNSTFNKKDEIIHIIAVSPQPELEYPSEVAYIIEKDNKKSYLEAAEFINSNYDACIIQHEYGIFGGHSGEYILDFCHKLHIPFVTNFHTILPTPSDKEKEILLKIGQISTVVTVMTNWAVNMLHSIYQIPTQKIIMIPHGVPSFEHNQKLSKEKIGFKGKNILLSFGFLGRGKGFETAIDAVSKIENDNFIYIILGVTHPNVLKHEGESYRLSLKEKCKQLNIEDKVIFINEFATAEVLNEYLSACDMYVTPYPNENQISSGTLTFALGAGAAVISTPYLYAKDLLINERGILFDFGNAKQLSEIINTLLSNTELLQKYRNNAKEKGESMLWSNIGKQHLKLMKNIISNNKLFLRA